MKRFALVATACAVMLVFVALRLNGGALTVGIVLGTWYFMTALAHGGGMAQLRITQDPGEPRKPGDPNNSIGLGLAAAGIAASVMANTDFPSSYRVFYMCCFAAGLLIALAFSGKSALLAKRAAADASTQNETASANSENDSGRNHGASE